MCTTLSTRDDKKDICCNYERQRLVVGFTYVDINTIVDVVKVVSENREQRKKISLCLFFFSLAYLPYSP